MNDDPDSLFIPSSERGRSIWEFPVSVRLGHVLQLANVRLIGDLHGRNVDEFARIRNCGKSTITELREIVRTLQAGGAEAPPVVPVKGDPTNALSIPEACRDILLEELPLPVRLRKALGTCGHSKLGNLHGVKVETLLGLRNVGRKCVTELRDLIHRRVHPRPAFDITHGVST